MRSTARHRWNSHRFNPHCTCPVDSCQSAPLSTIHNVRTLPDTCSHSDLLSIHTHTNNCTIILFNCRYTYLKEHLVSLFRCQYSICIRIYTSKPLMTLNTAANTYNSRNVMSYYSAVNTYIHVQCHSIIL